MLCNYMKNREIFNVLLGVIRDNARNGDFPALLSTMTITPDTTLDELGLDSLCKMSLLASLMDITDKYFPDEFFAGGRTLREIADHAV